MDTSQLLDLFSVEKEKTAKAVSGNAESGDSKSSMKAIMEDLGELWDETQYENEYNLDSFIQSMNPKWNSRFFIRNQLVKNDKIELLLRCFFCAFNCAA